MNTRITIMPAIYKQYRYSNGTYPIKVRITFNHKTTYITTNFFATQQQLTPSLTIKDTTLLYKVENYIHTIRERSLMLSPDELITMDFNDVVKYLIAGKQENKPFELDFFAYGRKFADEHIRGSGDNYRNALKALAAFNDLDWMSDKLNITRITSSMLRNFEHYLVQKYGKEARCVSLYTGHIRTIHKRAQSEFNDEELEAVRIKNPYLYYTPPSPPASVHRDMDKNTIQKLINICPYLKGAQAVAVEAYLLSFALMGMNIPDLFFCAPPKDGVLHYLRHKTAARTKRKEETLVRIPKEILPIYNKWKDKSGERAFSFYQRYTSFRNMQICIDRGMRMFVEQSGIITDNKLSFYSARHSWATLMSDSHMPISIINDGLSHVDPNYAITQIYIRKNWTNVWEANEKFLSENFDWTPLQAIVAE